MIIYVVIIENSMDTLSGDFYVKFVVDSEQKAKEKMEKLMARFAERHNFVKEDIRDYGDMQIVVRGDTYYMVSYERFEVG